MKHENITLSIPADLNALLHAKFPNRGISNYVSKVVRAALENDAEDEMQALEMAYREAENDPDRKKVKKEMNELDVEDDIEGWAW